MMEELTDTTDLGNRGEGYFVVQVILIVLVLFPPRAAQDALTTLGFVSFLGGAGFLTWAVTDLGDSLSPLPKPRSDAQLVTDGAYEYVRHPMYSGLILSCLGLGICTSSAIRIVLSLCLFLLLDMKGDAEEAFLLEKYGERYTAYQKAVKKLIPYLY